VRCSRVKRQLGFERVAETAEKRARSVRSQAGSAKLPPAKEFADIAFDGMPINAQPVQDPAGQRQRHGQRTTSPKPARPQLHQSWRQAHLVKKLEPRSTWAASAAFAGKQQLGAGPREGRCRAR
jgi:hypothetical protein